MSKNQRNLCRLNALDNVHRRCFIGETLAVRCQISSYFSAFGINALAQKAASGKCGFSGGYWDSPQGAYAACMAMTYPQALAGPTDMAQQDSKCEGCRAAERQAIAAIQFASSYGCVSPSDSEYEISTIQSINSYFGSIGVLASDYGFKNYCMADKPNAATNYSLATSLYSEFTRDCVMRTTLWSKPSYELGSHSATALVASSGQTSGSTSVAPGLIWRDAGNVGLAFRLRLRLSAGPIIASACGTKLGICPATGAPNTNFASVMADDKVKNSLIWRGLVRTSIDASSSSLKENEPLSKTGQGIAKKNPRDSDKPKVLSSSKTETNAVRIEAAKPYRARPPSGGLLDDDTGGFNQNGPSGSGARSRWHQ